MGKKKKIQITKITQNKTPKQTPFAPFRLRCARLTDEEEVERGEEAGLVGGEVDLLEARGDREEQVDVARAVHLTEVLGVDRLAPPQREQAVRAVDRLVAHDERRFEARRCNQRPYWDHVNRFLASRRRLKTKVNQRKENHALSPICLSYRCMVHGNPYLV